MGLFSAICHAFALSPSAQAEHNQAMKDYGIEPYTQAERAAMDAEDDRNYIEHISGTGTHRSSWYSQDGMTLHWKETVIDQRGHEHIVNSGSHYVGFSGFGRTNEIEKVYQGEIVKEEYIPVYKRLQG